MGHWIYLYRAAADEPAPMNLDDGEAGTTHLADFDEYHRLDGDERRVLCGRNAVTMHEIDETVSGRLATCKTCRRIAGIT